jgi:hypothetical protein
MRPLEPTKKLTGKKRVFRDNFADIQSEKVPSPMNISNNDDADDVIL